MAGYGFTDPVDSFRKGYGAVRELREDRAVSRAGNAMRAGRVEDAAGEFYGAGMLDQGMALQDRQAKQRQTAAGASRQQEEAVYKFVGEIAPRLHSIYNTSKDPAQTVAAFDQLSPRLRQLGETDEEIAEIRSSIERDPDLTLRALGAAAEQKLQFFQTDQGILKGDQGTGAVEMAYAMPRKPDWRERTLPDGSTEFFDINAEGAPPSAPAPAAPAAPAGAPMQDLDGLIQRLGATVTSGQRSAGRNAAVGGVGNSKHLTDEARDLRPPAGVSTGQLAARMRAELPPGYDVVDEGDHVHVEYDPKPYRVASNGATPPPPRGAIRGDAPKPQKDVDQWVDLPGGGQMNLRTGKKEGVPDGEGKTKAPTDGDKQTVAFAYRTLRANDRLNDLADRGVFKPTTPTAQLFDRSKNGVVRIVTKSAEDRQFIQSAKEWLAPILRKDTGAAVTDEELSTYMDIFIPKYEDDRATLQQKAEARQDTMIALVRQGGDLYSRTHGQRQFVSKYPGAPKQRTAAPPPPKVGTVRNGYRFKGGNPASPQSWVKV